MRKTSISVFFSVVTFTAVTLVSCLKEIGPMQRTQPVTTPSFCDSLNVKYSTDIGPIMQTNCALSGCHDASMSAPGNFNNYTDVQTIALNGKLWNRINTVGDMPPAGKLPNSELQKIDCWIQKGAPNN